MSGYCIGVSRMCEAVVSLVHVAMSDAQDSQMSEHHRVAHEIWRHAYAVPQEPNPKPSTLGRKHQRPFYTTTLSSPFTLRLAIGPTQAG